MPQNQPPQVRQSEKLYKIKPPRTQARDNSQADITKSTTPVSKYSLYKIIGTLLTWLSTITKSTTPRPQTRYKISIIKPGLGKTNDFVMIQRRDIIETIRYDTIPHQCGTFDIHTNISIPYKINSPKKKCCPYKINLPTPTKTGSWKQTFFFTISKLFLLPR